MKFYNYFKMLIELFAVKVEITKNIQKNFQNNNIIDLDI